MYHLLAAIFFLTLVSGLLITLGLIFKRVSFWETAKIYFIWVIMYIAFIFLGTGPNQDRVSFSGAVTPYKLPWRAEISRFVSQGNRSFTSHRGLHLYAWDFWMPIGTEILAARKGKVIKVVQNYAGIGFNSNYVLIEHDDKTKAMYSHIKTNGSIVKKNDLVQQGELLAHSGMVGQTINPHLHFVVFDSKKTQSLPISFSDVYGGVPLAGHFYISGNSNR